MLRQMPWNSSLLAGCCHGSLDIVCAGLRTDPLIDDGCGGFLGDGSDLCKGLVPDLADTGFGGRKLPSQFGLDRGAVGGSLGLGGFARGLADAIGLGTGGSQFLFIGLDGSVGVSLQARGLVQILGDAVMTLLEDA